MSRAFVREGEGEWLEDVSPTLNALIRFLTRENNGVRVYEVKSFKDNKGIDCHLMSNGLTYSKDIDGKWRIHKE